MEIKDNSQYVEGLPCFKYILNKLQYEEQALTYTKFFVQTMTALSFSEEEIVDMLSVINLSLPINHPLKHYDFASWPYRLEGLGLVTSVSFSSDVSSYSHCYDFYKEFESGRKACSICPLSKQYCNKNELEEKKILRYALESAANLEYLLSEGLLPTYFFYSIDIVSIISTKTKPFIVKIYRDMFRSLMDMQELNRYGMCVEENVENVIGIMFNSMRKKMTDLKESNAQELAMKIMGIYIESFVQDVELVSLEDVAALVQSLLSKKIKHKDSTRISASNMGIDNIVDFYGNSVDKKQLKDNEGAVLGNVVTPEDGIDIFKMAEKELANINVESEAVAYNAPVGEGANESTAIVISSYYFQENAAGKDSDEMTKDEYSSDELRFCELGNVFDETGLLWKEISNSLFGIPIVSYKELSHFAISLDEKQPRLLAMFQSHILKDKRMSVELVSLGENQKSILLMYSPRIHAYFFTDLEDEYVRSIVTSILSYPSVTKYCYYPFALVSILMKIGVYVKGVYSLFSLSASLYGNHRKGMYEMLDMMGGVKAVGGQHVQPEGEITSLPLLYMHCYHNIYRRMGAMLVKKGYWDEYEKRNQFDVILSRFYYQDLYCNKYDTLFTVPSASSYSFTSPKDRFYLRAGKLITYTFRNIPLEPTITIRELLCCLEDKGYYKKYKMMLTFFASNSFTIYVEDVDFAAVDTAINTTLLFFLRERNLHGLEYSASEQVAPVSEV